MREEGHTQEMFIEYTKGKGASPDGFVFAVPPPRRANILTSFVVTYKKSNKPVDAGLTLCEAADTKVKDFPTTDSYIGCCTMLTIKINPHTSALM